MNRTKTACASIVVCVTKSKIFILGDGGRCLEINRVNPTEICETESRHHDETYGSVYRGSGLLGFIELKGGKYLGLISRVLDVGSIGLDHKVSSIQEVDWIPVGFGMTTPSKQDSRYMHLINNLLKSGDFYFSHSLNLSGGNDRFSWNACHRVPNVSPEWNIDIIHGSLESLKFSSNNRRFQFVLIARRSRFFAGTRYRKRGLNNRGDCANEAETEQILIQIGPPDIVCSFKQVRGSVPLHWGQDMNSILGRPEIYLRNIDFDLSATRKHFQNLVSRYGSPVIPISLLSHKPGSSERNLDAEYAHALKSIAVDGVGSLRQFDLKAATHADISSDHHHAINSASMYREALPIARDLIRECGWTEQVGTNIVKRQNGIIRSNCVDCLDRTSIFQYIVGLEVLSEQLMSLGVLEALYRPTWTLSPDRSVNPLLQLVEDVFNRVSDQLALQYAGTAAHKKYASSSRQGSFDGGLINSGRELFISLSRHYSSTFTDNDKQHAMNLLLQLYKEVWDQLQEDDICTVEGIDKLVHARVTGGELETQTEAILNITRPNPSGGYETLVPSEWTPIFLQ